MDDENDVNLLLRSQETLPLVFSQLQDVVLTQKQVMDSIYSESLRITSENIYKDEVSRLQEELEDERREHARTKALLADKSDRLEFALGEIEILTSQLEREKSLFEASFGKISERVKKESTKTHKLEAQCTTIKAEKEKQDELLAFKDAKLSDLKKRLVSQKENHKRQLEEASIQRQQEAYISRNLATASRIGGAKGDNSNR